MLMVTVLLAILPVRAGLTVVAALCEYWTTVTLVYLKNFLCVLQQLSKFDNFINNVEI